MDMVTVGHPYTVSVGPASDESGPKTDLALLACECEVKNNLGIVVYTKVAGVAPTVSDVIPVMAHNADGIYDFTVTANSPTSGDFGAWFCRVKNDTYGLNAYWRWLVTPAFYATGGGTLTVTVAEMKALLMMDAADTTYDATIQALINLIQPAEEARIDPTYLADTTIWPTLKLGIMHRIAGIICPQLPSTAVPGTVKAIQRYNYREEFSTSSTVSKGKSFTDEGDRYLENYLLNLERTKAQTHVDGRLMTRETMETW